MQKAANLYERKTGKLLLSYQTPPDSLVIEAIVEVIDEMNLDFSRYEGQA
jgi:hypothetical protein